MEKNGHKFLSVGNAMYDLTSLFGAGNEPTSIDDGRLQTFVDNPHYHIGCEIKPIQSTPTLSEEDSKRIVDEVLRKPTDESIERNEKLLSDSKKAFK